MLYLELFDTVSQAIATLIHDHLKNNDIVDNFQSAVKLLC